MNIGSSFLGHKGPAYALCTAPANATFVSGSGDGTIVRWALDDPENGELMVNVGEAVFSLHLDEQLGLMLIGTEGGGLHVISLDTKQELQHFTVHRKGIFRIIALGGDRFACAGGDGSLSIWKYGQHSKGEGLQLHRQLPLVEEKLRDLVLSADGTRLAVACGDGTVRIFDTFTFNELHTLDAHPGRAEQPTSRGASSIRFHPHKPVLISGGKDGQLRFWRTDQDYRALHGIPAHKGGIYRILFNGNGTLCATCSRDKTAKVWDPVSFDLLHRLDGPAGGHSHSVNDILWLQDTLITASDDRKLKRWDLPA